MDSVTQIVLGAAVGEAALGKKIGNKAMFYGAIAGTIPDLDVLVSHFTDTTRALAIHRGFTHSIVFSVVFGLLFGWLASRYEKYKNPKEKCSIEDNPPITALSFPCEVIFFSWTYSFRIKQNK